MQAIEKRARQQGLKQLFVLTTKTAHWFIERGFCESDVETLPNEKKAFFNLQRNSKVFTRDLSAD